MLLFPQQHRNSSQQEEPDKMGISEMVLNSCDHNCQLFSYLLPCEIWSHLVFFNQLHHSVLELTHWKHQMWQWSSTLQKCAKCVDDEKLLCKSDCGLRNKQTWDDQMWGCTCLLLTICEAQRGNWQLSLWSLKMTCDEKCHMSTLHLLARDLANMSINHFSIKKWCCHHRHIELLIVFIASCFLWPSTWPQISNG